MSAAYVVSPFRDVVLLGVGHRNQMPVVLLKATLCVSTAHSLLEKAFLWLFSLHRNWLRSWNDLGANKLTRELDVV